MSKKVAFIADLHCGHIAGLTPDTFNSKSDAHGGKVGFDYRRSMHRFFKRGVDKYGPWDFVFVVGDSIDGKGDKNKGVEIMVPDRIDQAKMAGLCIRAFGKRPKVFMVRGTRYHTGKGENWEDLVAEHAGAEGILDAGQYDVGGVVIDVKHHLGNTTSPVSQYTALSKEGLNNLLWAERDEREKANLIVRAHVHRVAFCGTPNGPTSVSLPALQGITSYGARKYSGLPIDYGFMMGEIDNGDIQLKWHIQKLSAHKMPLVTV